MEIKHLLSGSILLSGRSKLSSNSRLETKEIKEVTPIKYHKDYFQILFYKRIETESLTREMLLRFYELLETKKPVFILEVPNYFLIQYDSKPIILVSKKDGRLYSFFDQGFKKGEIEHQASFVIRILKKYGLVEGVRYKKVKKEEWMKNKEERKIETNPRKSKVYKRRTQEIRAKER